MGHLVHPTGRAQPGREEEQAVAAGAIESDPERSDPELSPAIHVDEGLDSGGTGGDMHRQVLREERWPERPTTWGANHDGRLRPWIAHAPRAIGPGTTERT